MKIKNNIYKWVIPVSILLMGFLLACSESYPDNIESTNYTVLESIKIVNAGANGNTELEGRIDENTKTIWFPRIDPATNVSAIRFEATMSAGAKLDKEEYAFDFEEGKDSKSITIKVVNEPRFREYRVDLRLNVPVFGADFSNFTAYDHSGNTESIYPTFSGSLTRGSGFDGEHVLIVTRHEMGSHLLSVDDLKNGVVKPIKLNMTGVAGGIFAVNRGQIVNGHTYVINLSGLTGLKIYHWENPEDAPQVILAANPADIEGAGDRHGDNYSMNLDKDGNGFIFLGANDKKSILRFTVKNYTEITEPKVLATHAGVSNVLTYNRVEDTDDYLLSGYDTENIYVVDSESSLSYTFKSHDTQSVGARIVSFNGERYLLYAISPRYRGNSVLYVYDITKGENTVEALEFFNEGDKTPLLQYSLGGSFNTAPGTDTGYKVIKDADGNDSVLRLYAASNDAGFAVIDIPKKELDE